MLVLVLASPAPSPVLSLGSAGLPQAHTLCVLFSAALLAFPHGLCFAGRACGEITPLDTGSQKGGVRPLAGLVLQSLTGQWNSAGSSRPAAACVLPWPSWLSDGQEPLGGRI